MHLREYREGLTRAVFTHPPSDWAEFQKRLGRWVEVDRIIALIEGKNKEQDDG